jgi:hypothetical protein
MFFVFMLLLTSGFCVRALALWTKISRSGISRIITFCLQVLSRAFSDGYIPGSFTEIAPNRKFDSYPEAIAAVDATPIYRWLKKPCHGAAFPRFSRRSTNRTTSKQSHDKNPSN